MNIAIIQARLASSRFPEKILQPIYKDMNSLDILITRLKMCSSINYIVIATTENPNDDKLVDYIKSKYSNLDNIHIYRGNENDVFDRITKTAEYIIKNIPEYFRNELSNITLIEVTSDCPFIDPEMLDTMLRYYYRYDYDYLSNIITRGFPVGFDIQIYKSGILNVLNTLITNKNHKTHGGWNIVNYSNMLMGYAKLKIGNFHAAEKYFHPTYRIVLDYPEDLELLKNIANHFDRLDFTIENIMQYIEDNPEVLEINKNCAQKIAGTDKVKE